MKFSICAILISAILYSCQDTATVQHDQNTDKDSVNKEQPKQDTTKTQDPEPTTYSNQRFREVTVVKTAPDTYRVRGEGQIFEANFGWVVEDGHNELKGGHQMTDAGAPDWGKFDFSFTVQKQRANSTLHLILYETSAKDGSRVHELHIPLN